MNMVMTTLMVELDTDEIANRVEQFIQSLPDVEMDDDEEYVLQLDLDEDKFHEMMELYWHIHKLSSILWDNRKVGYEITNFYFMLMSQQEHIESHVRRIVGHDTFVQMMVDGAI